MSKEDHMKLVPLSLVVTLIVLAAFSTSAGATSSSGSSRATTQSFCGVARGVARDIVNSTSFSNGRALPANVKTTWKRIAAAEPALMSSASTPIKADLRPVFGFVNLLIADFEKANWTASGLARYAPALVPRAQAIQPQLHALKAYFNGTCKLGV
jgi:hypothetical protein